VHLHRPTPTGSTACPAARREHERAYLSTHNCGQLWGYARLPG
jgi:hypothetical protein